MSDMDQKELLEKYSSAISPTAYGLDVPDDAEQEEEERQSQDPQEALLQKYSNIPMPDGRGGYLSAPEPQGPQEPDRGLFNNNTGERTQLEKEQAQYLEDTTALERTGERLKAGARDVGQRYAVGRTSATLELADRQDQRAVEEAALLDRLVQEQDDPSLPYNPWAAQVIRNIPKTLEQRSQLAAQAREGAAESMAYAQKLEEANSKYIGSPVAKAAMESKNLSDMFDAMKIDPISFIAEIGTRSAPQMVEMIALSMGGAAIGAGSKATAVLGGSGSATAAYGADVLKEIKKAAGGDLSDEAAVMRVLTDEKLMDTIRTTAAKYAAPIGAFDAVSMGFASKTLFGKYVKEAVANKVGALAGQTAGGVTRLGEQVVLQAGSGMAGEATGSLAAGRDINPVEVVAEGFGELITGPTDVLTSVKAGHNDRRRAKQQDLYAEFLNAHGHEMDVLSTNEDLFKQRWDEFIANRDASQDDPSDSSEPVVEDGSIDLSGDPSQVTPPGHDTPAMAERMRQQEDAQIAENEEEVDLEHTRFPDPEEDPLSEDNIIDAELDMLGKTDQELREEYEAEQRQIREEADAEVAANRARRISGEPNYAEGVRDIDDMPISEAAEDGGLSNDEQSTMEEELRSQAEAQRAADDYVYDDDLESHEFMSTLAKDAGVELPNSTTVESQETEPSSRGTNDEESTTQSVQDNDGNTVAGDSQERNTGIDPDIGQQEDTTAARSEQQPVSQERDETGNVAETRVDNEAEVDAQQDTNAAVDINLGSDTATETQAAAKAQTEAAPKGKKPAKKTLTAKDKRRIKSLEKFFATTVEKTKGRVQVFDSFEESTLSDEQKDALRARAEEGKITPAYYDYADNKIYMFADNIRSTSDARGLMAHEVFHAGLVDLFGNEKTIRENLESLFASHPDMDSLLDRIAHRSGFDPALYSEPYADGTTDIDLPLFIEEAIAHMREHQESAAPLKKLFTDVIRRLRDLGHTIRNRPNATAEQLLQKLVKDAENAFYSQSRSETRKRESNYGKPRHATLANRYATRPEVEKIEFYSKLYEAAVALKQKKGSPQQMLAMLRKQPGIKPEEILWTGLDNWMELQGKSVTKDAIIEYLYANGVQIETVIGRNDSKRTSSLHEFQWQDHIDESRENYETRIDDLMDDYDTGFPDRIIFDVEDAQVKYYENHPELIMELFKENYSDSAEVLSAIDYLRRQSRGDTETDLFEESTIEEALEKLVRPSLGMDLDTLRQFAESLEDTDIAESLRLLDVEIDYDRYREEYKEAVEAFAQKEYMDDPVVESTDERSGLVITGSDDRGFRLHTPGVYDVLVYDTFDEAETAAREWAEENETAWGELGDYFDVETRFHDHVMPGDYTRYDEVRIVLPQISPEYTDGHWHEDNVVAFYTSTDRKIEIDSVDGDKTMKVRPYFIEELQSDWHQEGRRKGYFTEEARAEYFKESVSLKETMDKLTVMIAKRYLDYSTKEGAFVVGADPNRVSQWLNLLEAMKAGGQKIHTTSILRRINRAAYSVLNDDLLVRWSARVRLTEKAVKKIEALAMSYVDSVPNAPYKGTAWMELAAKKAIGEAIQEGNPYVAWPESGTIFKHWRDPDAVPLYQTVYDKQLPKIMGKLAGEKAFKSVDGHWVVMIKDEKVSEYAAKGLPKFATRRSGAGLTNLATINRERFERSGLWGIYDDLKRKYAEKYETMKRVNQHISKVGGRVDDSTDAYRALKRIPGRTMARMHEFEGDYLKPLKQIMKDHKLHAEDIGLYMYALHAGERNDFYRDRYGLPMTDFPSGMSEQEAGDIIAAYRASNKIQGLDQAAVLVESMREQMLKRATDAGIMHTYVADEYNDRYDHFVPLKGFSVTTDANGKIVSPDEVRKPLFTKGMSITGKEFRRALGRQSKAYDPLATLISDATETLVRAENNEAMQHFLRFAQANQDPNQWEIFTAKRPDKTRAYKTVKDPVTGQKVERVERINMPESAMAANYVGVKYRGTQYYIKVADKRLHDMMTNGDIEKLGAFLSTAKRYNRFLSYMYTSLSPAFAAANFVKDVPSAYLKIKAEQTLDDGVLQGRDIGKDVVKSVFPAMSSMRNLLLDRPPRPGNQMDLDAIEMRDNGGLVGYFAVKNPERYRAELEGFVRHSNKKYSGTLDRAIAMRDWIDRVNKMIENAIRLSAYHHARNGPNPVSIKRGADFARELTVDFNARGTGSNGIGALFLFFNPAIQGTRQFKRAVIETKGTDTGFARFKPKNYQAAQKILIGATVSHAFYLAGVRALMGQDDDGEDYLDKVASYHRERSLIIPKIWTDKPGDYYAFPLPYGFSAVTAAGAATEMVIAGALKGQGMEAAKRASAYMTSAILTSFSPIAIESPDNVAEMIIKTATPQMGKPVLELLLNKNHFGSSIYSENKQFGTPLPDSHLGRLNTGEAYKDIAKALNDWTGGTDMTSGWFDVHPETFRYWVKHLSGGIGTLMIDQIGNAAWSTFNGAPYNWENVPVFAGWNSSVKDYDDISKFYERSNDVLRVLENKQQAVADGDSDQLEELQKKYGDIDTLVTMSTTYRKQMAEIRKVRNAAQLDEDMDGREKYLLVKDMDEQIGLLAKLFNKEYLALMRAR